MSVASTHSLPRTPYRSEEPGNEGLPAPANMEPQTEQQRSSGGSGRSTGSRSRQNPQQQLSTIEKSVTHLLVATKQLLETLTMWSRGTATEGEVSDVYVRLGYEFNIACRAFSAIGVDTSDLGPVPDLLRAILEDTLSQEASQASLDKFLPRIRDIIINLLHGLKKKQQRLRQKGTTGSGSSKDGGALPPRQGSVASVASTESQVNQQLEELPGRTQSSKSYMQRQGSGDVAMPDLPPRTTSAPGRQSPRRSNLSPQNSVHQSASRDTIASDSGSSMSSNAMQNIPVITPYPEHDTIPTNTIPYEPQPQPLQDQPSPSTDPPPKPPPKQNGNDALSALQRGGELERRASRRFSAYQIQKHLGTSMNGIAQIPPAQNSPIPNRGRDVRESMSAVRSRGSVLNSRAKSRNQGQGGAAASQYEPSPNRIHEVRRISEEPSESGRSSALDTQPPSRPFTQDDRDQLGSPMVKTPEDKLGSYGFPDTPQSPRNEFSATINGPMADEPFYPETAMSQLERRKTPTPVRSASRKAVIIDDQRTPPQSQYVPEGSPQPGKELTLFLQYKSKIKKFVLPDGGDLSLARLQLAFIEKFAWSTQNNGADLPEIYIQDPVSGVRHELEDLIDVKERSVLVLNVEALDEVKRHIDDGLGGLRRIVEGIKTSVEEQSSSLQRVSDRQQETAKEIASIAASPPSAVPTTSTGTGGGALKLSSKDKAGQLGEVQKLRRDLAVVRQTYTSFVSDMNASMTTLRTKAASVKKVAADTATPDMDSNSGRTYVNKGKKTLSDDSEKIVNRVDDLQDVVEDLRKDVVSRGVRPLPRQLESVSKDISTATADLKKLQEFLKREKPVWTKIWEKELQVVCDDRDLLTLQEELAVDLEDDLEKAAATFALVEQATKQQNLHKPADGGEGKPGPGQLRSTSGQKAVPIVIERGGDPLKAKDSVLGEVRALQPNHENRLEAIERAERARQRELEHRRGGEFQRELGSFVDENKLKKTGGVEEVERVRLMREEKTRRDVLETQQRRMRERAEKEAEANGAPPEVNGLEVPDSYEGGRESSPEPGFVDAREDAENGSGP
ncbi:Bud site selection protein 6 [Vermiconidia calcicola]|uniref:Bud site selection protein 6 n=1 Tax=Vermiconidia calcicola TaxID=1690605 RepID=A0ACC3NTT5_9PEZI|nr:Bud site selection protein 6 [Vermiconidia calcicola]